MLRLFADNLLPVFLVAGAGYALAARSRIDAPSVSRLAFFVLAPCFVFDAIVASELASGALARMMGFAIVAVAVPVGAAALIAASLGWRRSLVAAVFLVVLLPNAGNYGLSVNRFAFGEDGLAHASIFFVTSAMTTFTVGVFVASLGRKSLGASLAGLVRVPAVWAVAAAFACLQAGWSPPFPIERAVGLLADACIPVFLLILGVQLHGKGIAGPAGPLALVVAARLVAGAAWGVALGPMVGLDGVARQVGAVQAGMPSAVVCIILATEYDVEPSFVTGAVFASTILSPLTLTPLLAFVSGG